MKTIVELGSNHLNQRVLGRNLIKKIDNGSMVKFQLWKAKDLYKKNIELYKPFELGFDLASDFFDYGIQCGIDVFFSVFYVEAVDFCERLGVKYYKIAARSNNDKVLVEKTLSTGKPVFMSFSSLYPMTKYHMMLMNRFRIIPMYTISKYPPDKNDFSIDVCKQYVDMGGGYSNHYTNTFFCKLSVLLGVKYVELHVFNPFFCGNSPDSVCSVDYDDYNEFIRWCRS